jgi:hypothetical protein
VGRGHAACACACLPHRRRSPQQTTYTNGLRRARQGRGGRGRLRKGSGASRTDPTDREEVPTRKVVSNRGGVSAGVSLHRGAAVGGARAEGTAERRHSTAPLRLRRLPAESSRPAELWTQPTRPNRALAARVDPPRGTHHPPRPQRAPAGRAPGELPAGVGRPGELILRVAGGDGGGAAALGCPGQLSEGPGCPSGASSESGSTSLPRRFRRQRAACGSHVGEHGSRLGRVLERGGTAAGGWSHLQVPEVPPEVESCPSRPQNRAESGGEVPESDKRMPESGRKVAESGTKVGRVLRFGAEWALCWADTGATRTHRGRLEGPTRRTPGPLARPSGGTGGRLAAGRVATRCGESPGPGPTRRSEWELATTVRAATSCAAPSYPVSSSLRDKIRLLGFTTLHDSRRYAIPRCLDPSHPDTKARCTGDDEYAPTNLGTRPGRRCRTAVRNRRSGPCRAPPKGTTRPCGP